MCKMLKYLHIKNKVTEDNGLGMSNKTKGQYVYYFFKFIGIHQDFKKEAGGQRN